MLVVKDVITTGGSVKEVAEIVKLCSGIVAGVSSIVDTTGGKIDFETKFSSVISMKVNHLNPKTALSAKLIYH